MLMGMSVFFHKRSILECSDFSRPGIDFRFALCYNKD